MKNNLRRYRAIVGQSATKIADLSGVSYKTYLNIERCGSTPRPETIGKLLKGFEAAGLKLEYEQLEAINKKQ